MPIVYRVLCRCSGLNMKIGIRHLKITFQMGTWSPWGTSRSRLWLQSREEGNNPVWKEDSCKVTDWNTDKQEITFKSYSCSISSKSYNQTCSCFNFFLHSKFHCLPQFAHLFGLTSICPLKKSSMRQRYFILFCILIYLQWLELCLVHNRQ